MKLSEHFDDSEFMCTCNGRHCSGLPEQGIDPNLPVLLEAIRAHFGKPVHINSGYRCPKRNAEVDGKPKSKHMEGIAADITIAGIPPRTVANVAESALRTLRSSSVDFKDIYGGIGIYPAFTHVDVRKNKARW